MLDIQIMSWARRMVLRIAFKSLKKYGKLKVYIVNEENDLSVLKTE